MSNNLQTKLAELELERLYAKKGKDRKRSTRVIRVIVVAALFIYLSGKVPYWMTLYFSG